MKKLINQKGDYTTRDPYIVRHNNMYYHCFTKDTESLYVSCADTIEGLSAAESKCVYTPEENREYSKQLWAPELHIIDNKCYIYVACDDGDNYNHRMYVLENNSDNPMDDYVMHGKIMEKNDKWAIDGTIMKYNGKNYFVWSGWEGDTNVCQNLYIAGMKNPYELDTERVLISAPEFDWEKLGSSVEEGLPYINEGPFAFVAGDNLYLTYSAAGSWCEDYCIALLKLVGTDPLNPKSWEKVSTPILSANDKVKGGGHCSVVCEDDKMHVFFYVWDKEEENVNWKTVSVWHADLKISQDNITIK